jgi:hypothetical protein
VKIPLRRPSWRTLVAAALLLPAIGQVVTVAKIVLSRVAYPMDIEWLEGGELYQAYRWIHGQSIYGPPEQGYLPYLHPPGHFVLLGLVGRLAGLDYATGRMVSILFFALACAIVAREVFRHAQAPGEGALLAVLAVGGAVASFPVVGGFYDLIRNDTMGLGLSLAGAALAVDPRPTRGKTVVIALVLAGSCFTRLPFIFLNLWTGLFLLARNPRRGLLLASITGLLGGAGLALLQYVSDGWFWTYCVTILAGHPIDGRRFLVALRSILGFAPYLPLLPLVFIVLARDRKFTRRSVLWFGLLVAAVPAGLLPFAKLGGFDNDLIPVVFLAGPVAAMLWADLVRGRSAGWVAGAWGRWTALTMAAAWLAWRGFDPGPFIPDADRHRRAARLNAFVAGLDGGVIIPNHPFLPIRNGQDVPQFHTMPYLDVIGMGLGEALYPYIEASHAKWAILDGGEPFVRENVISLYAFVGPVPDVVPTMVGFPSAPRLLFKRREPLSKANARVLFDFESPSFEGWTVTGDAFPSSPSAGKPPGQLAITGYSGRGLASSYARGLGDAARGELISPPFILDRTHLALLVGGARTRATRVELRVDGRTVQEASGPGGDIMVPIVWDVSAFGGREARIAILDDDSGPGGHVLVDQIELFD